MASSASAQSAFAPTAVFAQAGKVGETRSVTVGTTWDWNRQWSVGSGRLGGYTEASISGWSHRDIDHDRRWLGQLELTPVFRYRFADGQSPWFAEAGIGLTVTNRLFVTDSKRFSTAFNFGDHLGVGRSFGEAGQHEIALRVEHYSNGSIKEPNPGITFLQIRYAYRLK